MRHRYHESPGGAREESLRRVSRLTWRTGQLGALATVGFAVVFARTAPAPAANVPAANVQPTPTLSVIPTGPGYPTVAATQATVKPRARASTRPASAATTAPAGHAAAPPTSQAAAPTTQQAPPPASTAPSLAPPTTAPAPAPPSSAPAPTVTSASYGGG